MSPDKLGGSLALQDCLTPKVFDDWERTDDHRQRTSKGEICLEGHVLGDVHCVALVLGENSSIEGNVTDEDVVIRGRLIGSVRALRVTLHSTSHLEGDLIHRSLVLEQGAYFEGKSRRSADPLSTDTTPTADPAESKPKPVPNDPEKLKEKSESVFVRSLPELD